MANLRSLQSTDEEQIFQWRTSPEVAQFMFSDGPIDSAQHHQWFQNNINDVATRIARILEHQGQPFGFVSLTDIDKRHRVCKWGGYLGPNVPRGRGFGKALLYLSVDYAFSTLKINRIEVEVILTNYVARELYRKCGFREEGVMRERAQKKDGPVDVLLMSLLHREWSEISGLIKHELTTQNLIP